MEGRCETQFDADERGLVYGDFSLFSSFSGVRLRRRSSSLPRRRTLFSAIHWGVLAGEASWRSQALSLSSLPPTLSQNVRGDDVRGRQVSRSWSPGQRPARAVSLFFSSLFVLLMKDGGF